MNYKELFKKPEYLNNPLSLLKRFNFLVSVPKKQTVYVNGVNSGTRFICYDKY